MEAKKVLVGLSGGMDSSVLLHQLACFSHREGGPKLVAAHIHHGLRGKEADADQEQAENQAFVHGVECVVRKVTPDQGSSEEVLRNLRFKALTVIARDLGADLVVLGHHMQDQAETLLYRLFRGSDVQGLSSMAQLRDGFWFRPLLSIEKSEIVNEAKHRGLGYRVDQSNFDTSYARNAIRHNVLPILQTSFNPNIINKLAEMATSFDQVNAYLDRQIQSLIPDIVDHQSVLNRKSVSELDPILRKRLFQRVYRNLAGLDQSLARKQLQQLNDVIEQGSIDRSFSFAQKIGVVCSKDVIIFSRSR